MLIVCCDTCGKEICKKGLGIEDLINQSNHLNPFKQINSETKESIIITSNDPYYRHLAIDYGLNETSKYIFCSRECFLKRVKEIYKI